MKRRKDQKYVVSPSGEIVNLDDVVRLIRKFSLLNESEQKMFMKLMPDYCKFPLHVTVDKQKIVPKSQK